jgi:hypothetical protein
MDIREEAAGEFTDTSKVDESAVLAKGSDSRARERALSKPKKQKAAKRATAAGKTSGAKKLVCRYCGSDDLAPSFKKRRDARCRACFAKRYSSRSTGKKTKRSKKA